MRIGIKKIGRELKRIGHKAGKPLRVIGSKRTLTTIDKMAATAQKIGAGVSAVAPELGVPLMGAASGVRAGVGLARETKSAVAAAKRGDLERAASKAKSVGAQFV